MVVALFLGLTLLLGNACEWFGQSDKVGDRELTLGPSVTHFKFSGDYEINYIRTVGAERRVTLRGDVQKLRDVELRVEQDTLFVVDKARKRFGRVSRRFWVEVVGAAPQEFVLQGGRSLEATAVGAGQPLGLLCHEFTGDVHLGGTFSWIGVCGYDSYGEIELRGESQSEFFSMFGAQRINAEDMRAAYVGLECGRLLGARVYATDSLVVHCIEAVDVYYKGNPGIRVVAGNGVCGTILPLRE